MSSNVVMSGAMVAITRHTRPSTERSRTKPVSSGELSDHDNRTLCEEVAVPVRLVGAAGTGTEVGETPTGSNVGAGVGVETAGGTAGTAVAGSVPIAGAGVINPADPNIGNIVPRNRKQSDRNSTSSGRSSQRTAFLRGGSTRTAPY